VRAPADFDDKSWSDVCQMEEAIREELQAMRPVPGQEPPDAIRIALAFERIERYAAVGALAAGWCKP
jgi:hypothetical protein